MKPPASKRARRRHTPTPAEDVDPLVLAILRAAYEAACARRLSSYYVDVDSLGLPSDPDRIDAAIMLAALAGWPSVGGKSAHSVALTYEGQRLLKRARRGMGAQ